jgi:hypothetical protein
MTQAIPEIPDSPAAFPESRRAIFRSATGDAVVKGILAALWQSARYLVHNLDDFSHDIAAVATGGALEQIVNRRADCHLSIIGAGEIPIVLI